MKRPGNWASWARAGWGRPGVWLPAPRGPSNTYRGARRTDSHAIPRTGHRTRRHTALAWPAPDTHEPKHTRAQTPARPPHPASWEADTHPLAPLQTTVDPGREGGPRANSSGFVYRARGRGPRWGLAAGRSGRPPRPGTPAPTAGTRLAVRASPPPHFANLSTRTMKFHTLSHRTRG